MLLQPRIDGILGKRRSAGPGCLLRPLRDVPVVLKEVENRLDALHGLERPAHAHGVTPVEVVDVPLLELLEDHVGVLVHRILGKNGVGGLRVVQEVPAKPDRVLHGLARYGKCAVDIEEVVALVGGCPAEEPGDAQHVADELSSPVGHLRIVGRELGLQPVGEGFKLAVGFRAERDGLRSLRVLVVQQVHHQTLIGAVDTVGHGLAPVAPASHTGDGHAVEEPRGEPSSAEGRVAEDRGDDVRLRHQEDGERRVHDAFTVPADTVDADRVAGVALEHDVDVHVPRVDAGERVEDAALTGDQRGVAVVAGDDGDELLGRNIIHIQLQRIHFLEVGDLLRDALKLLRIGVALGDLLLEGLLPALQHALLHASRLDGSGVGLVVFDLVVVDRLQHQMQYRRLPLGRRCDDDHVGVERLHPVGLALNPVLLLKTGRQDADCNAACHVDAGLRALRDSTNIVGYRLRECVDREGCHRVP